MSRQISYIALFSKHLFWDVNKSNLDLEKNASYIVKHVLEYGLMNDWVLLRDYYGVKQIGEIARALRDLDNKTRSFISVISGIPKEKFRCYTYQQLTPQHWNF